MEFIDFIKSLPRQEDKDIMSFIKWVTENKDFPDSSHPVVLASYLFDKLDWNMTHAYQKLYVLYGHAEPDNRIPRNYKSQDKLMEAINLIVNLKNNAGHNPEVQPAQQLKATKPREYWCFFPCSIPTEKDGDAFMYLFVDAYSGFTITTGLEKNDSDKNILKHMRLLLENENFGRREGETFTVVMHKYYQMTKAVSVLLEPFGGKVIINEQYVTEIVTPVMEKLLMKMVSGIPS